MDRDPMRLYQLVEEIYRDRDTITVDEIVARVREAGMDDVGQELAQLPSEPIPKTALVVAVDRLMAGLHGSDLWAGQDVEAFNPNEPAGGAPYDTAGAGTAGMVEHTDTENIPVKTPAFGPGEQYSGAEQGDPLPAPIDEGDDSTSTSRRS